MKKTAKHNLMAALAVTLGCCASFAQAQAQAPAMTSENFTSVYVIDQRGDVVLNNYSQCWRTGYWTPAAAAQDKNGCKCDKDLIPKEVCEPAAAPKPMPQQPPAAFGEKVTIAADALFDFNKAVLRPEGRAKLDEVVAKAGQLELEVVIAVGHTDRIGSVAYNQRLSEKRAASVKDYLVAKGIPANRVYTEGKGKSQPVTKPNECRGPKSKKVIACLQPDRRVDIELIGRRIMKK